MSRTARLAEGVLPGTTATLVRPWRQRTASTLAVGPSCGASVHCHASMTQVWVPDRYWGSLIEAGPAIEIGLLPDPRDAGSVPWPWPDIAPLDFVGRDEGGWIGYPRRVMSAEEAAVLGLSDNGGVVQRIYLLGPDGETIYSFSLWPMVPSESN